MKNNMTRAWDGYIVILFVLIMAISSGRLVMTRWTDDLILVQSAAILGTILGLALGVSYFGKTGRRILIIGYSVLFIPWLLLNLIIGEDDLAVRLASLAGRAAYALGVFFRAEPVEDPLLFIATASLLFWLIGIISGQKIIESRKILAGLIPPSIPIILIQYYDGFRAEKIWVLAIYFGLILLVIGRINYLQSAKLWREKHIFTGTEPEFDLNNSIILLTILIIILAWLLPPPASAIPAAARWWRESSQSFKIVQERINNALAALTGPPLIVPERYGNILAMGNNAAEGDSILFRVKTPSASASRYYWRVRVYDTYKKGNWQSAETRTLAFSPDAGEFGIPISGKENTEFEFEWLFIAQSALALPNQPVWVSRPATLKYSPIQTEPMDLINVRADPPLAPGERYRARSIVINPSILDLRQAGEKYPFWVQERYLSLPETLSPRISSLAQEITREYTTPYDKAAAITDYLRKNIAYKTTVPTPPFGLDTLEWFLLTWKSGYCTYSATAEVILLRSVGIPARLAVGYAEGKQENGLFVVRAKNAHAWPEVYFPEIGWVEFEPTANQLPLTRPSGIELEANNEPDEKELYRQLGLEDDVPLFNDKPIAPPAPTTTLTSDILQYKVVLSWIIIILAFGIPGYWLWRQHLKLSFARRLPKLILAIYHNRGASIPSWLKSWECWSELNEVERAFHAVNQCLAWLRKTQPRHMTPAERVQELTELVPTASQDIKILAQEHEKTLYSPTSGNSSSATRAGWKVRYYTIQQIVRQFFLGAPV